jgi:hypothetical protein
VPCVPNNVRPSVPLDNHSECVHESLSKPLDERPPILQQYLEERDVPCPSCGYNLHALRGSECPECGERLVLRVALAEPDLGMFLAALIGLALGVGFSGLLSVYFLIEGFTGNLSAREWREFSFACFLPFALEGIALAVLVWRRGHFQRLTARRQAVVIAGAWAMTTAAFVVFRVTID